MPMNSVFALMLNKYPLINNQQKENAVKEIVQEIVLSGLSRGGFFEKAVFYGGTCLRILYGLDRFSEDLDFALIKKDDSFALEHYFPSVRKELLSYGLNMEITKKEKNREESEIQSAFIKGNSQIILLSFFPDDDFVKNIVKDQVIKIKFEIDLDNPEGGVVVNKYRLLPSPYEIKVFDEATLFAGKIHAILCRTYKNRIKGRDYYDYLFYCSKDTPINLTYLESKLKNSNRIKQNEKITIDIVKQMLKERFESIDYELAKKDVVSFINNPDSLMYWNKDMFISTLDNLSGC